MSEVADCPTPPPPDPASGINGTVVGAEAHRRHPRDHPGRPGHAPQPRELDHLDRQAPRRQSRHPLQPHPRPAGTPRLRPRPGAAHFKLTATAEIRSDPLPHLLAPGSDWPGAMALTLVCGRRRSPWGPNMIRYSTGLSGPAFAT